MGGLARRSVGLGYDEGTVLIKIGREEPVASMDASGKIIWARHNEVQTANVKSLGADFEDVRARPLPRVENRCVADIIYTIHYVVVHHFVINHNISLCLHALPRPARRCYGCAS